MGGQIEYLSIPQMAGHPAQVHTETFMAVKIFRKDFLSEYQRDQVTLFKRPISIYIEWVG